MIAQVHLKTQKDLSFWVLIFSNLITIYLAIVGGWSLSTIMWVYWTQSVIIGFFNFVRLFQLSRFTQEEIKQGGNLAIETKKENDFLAFFFAMHYGMFHYLYLFFLISGGFPGMDSDTFILSAQATPIMIGAIIFFCNHLFSYLYNRSSEIKKQGAGALMLYPYARVVPMHLTIVLGLSVIGGPIVFFLILKTLADAVMHVLEHKIRKEYTEKSPQASGS